MSTTVDEYRIFTKDFFLVFGALLFSALVMYALMSTVTEYATSLGSSATIAGLVSGLYIFGGLCSRIYSGNALENVGWKKIALIFMTIHFLSCLLYFVVNDVTLLLIVRFIHGIGFGATVGPYGCFLAASIFSGLALIFIYFVDVSEHDPGNNPDLVKDRQNEYSGIEKVFEIKAIPVSFFTALTSLGYVSILSFYRLYAAEVDLAAAFSWFFIVYSIVLVLSRPIAGKIQDNNGDLIICVVGIVAQVVGLFLIAIYPSTLTVLVCAVCAALGFGTLNSACTTIVTRNACEHRRSYAVSTFYIFCDGTMGFGPALLGLFAANGYAPVYLISSIITLLALPICIYALKN